MDISRVAVVTGAARGIGAAVATRLASDGYRVALVDLDADGAESTSSHICQQGGTARSFSADVADSDRIRALVEDITDTLGAPTVLINNAGIIRDNLLFKMSDQDWDLVMNVHLRGAFLMSREVQKHQVESGWGRIVNISSTSALGNKGQANYAAAKAGVQGFTKTLALELGKFNVTVNAIAPGVIQTDLTASTAARIGVSHEEFIAQSAAEIPVGRVGQPEDIAAVASFFCSDQASFVSGQVLYVAGGPRN